MNTTHRKEKRPFCVFTSAGDASNVSSWIPANGVRSWDLIVAFYGNSEEAFAELAEHADVIFRIKGSKFQNLKKLYANQPGLLNSYEYVWVTDDDLTFESGNVEELFQIAVRFDFTICQPAFSHQGRISHWITMNAGPTHYVRIVNFIEVTCPVFRGPDLCRFLDVYDGHLIGWGIDWWFCNFFNTQECWRAAVIDAITVLNPLDNQRKTPGREITNLLNDDGRNQQWQDVKRRYRLTEFAHEVHGEMAGPVVSKASLKPNMGHAEFRLFESFASKSSNYFEIGGGMSTWLAASLVKTSVTVANSSRGALQKIQQSCLETKARLIPEIAHMDIGRLGDWGFPADETSRELWPHYHEVIAIHPAAKQADFIVITGRFRVACFMQAILNCRADAFIAIGNFAERPEYHVCRDVASEVAEARNLAIFRPAGPRMRERAEELLRAYAFTPK